MIKQVLLILCVPLFLMGCSDPVAKAGAAVALDDYRTFEKTVGQIENLDRLIVHREADGTETKFSLMHLAVTSEDRRYFNLLKDAGASMLVEDHLGRVPAEIAAVAKNYGLVCEVILDSLKEGQWGNTARIIRPTLLRLPEDEMEKTVTCLMKSELTQEERASILAELMAVGVPEDFLYSFFEADNYSLGWKSVDGDTLVHYAASYSYEKVLSLLEEKGASFDVQDDRGFTPLHLAATLGDLETIETVMNYQENWTTPDHEGLSAIFYVVANNCFECWKYMIERGYPLPEKETFIRASKNSTVQGSIFQDIIDEYYQ